MADSVPTEIINDKGPNASYLGKYYTKMTIGKYKRPTPFKSSEFETKKIIFFPLPVDLRDSTSVRYSEQNLESIGDLINGDYITGVGSAALRNVGNIVNNVGTNFTGALAETAFGKGSKLASGIEQITSSFLNPDQIASAVQQSYGKAPNPNPSVMFTGPDLRTFSYSWTFYPNNESESLNLHKIIQTLKRAALPENTFGNAAAILNYPNMVQLNFYPWDEKGSGSWGWNDDTSILKYKKCMMRSVNVNYSPGGAPGFFHGTFNGPVSATITIEFLEIEYMLSGDWGGDRGIGAGTLADIISGIESAAGAAIDPVGTLGRNVTEIISGATL